MTETNPTMSEDFIGSVQRRMLEAGLPDAELVASQGDASHFGDALAIYRIGPLLLRVTRERSLEFIDIGAADEPDLLYQLDDIEVAFGWVSMDDVLLKQYPEDLEVVLARVSRRLSGLQRALSGDRASPTRARIAKAESRRGVALASRFGASRP